MGIAGTARPCQTNCRGRGPRGLFPAQAGAAPPKASWARQADEQQMVQIAMGDLWGIPCAGVAPGETQQPWH